MANLQTHEYNPCKNRYLCSYSRADLRRHLHANGFGRAEVNRIIDDIQHLLVISAIDATPSPTSPGLFFLNIIS